MKYKKRTIAARTFERYVVNAKRYIYPHMGDYLPQNITTNLLQDFLGGMLDNGYALDTVKHIKYQLGQYFEYCIDEEIIDKNPVSKVRLQSRERKTKDAAEQQEYKAIPEELRDRFLQAIGTSVLFKPLCLTSMFAGLRIGEVGCGAGACCSIGAYRSSNTSTAFCKYLFVVAVATEPEKGSF